MSSITAETKNRRIFNKRSRILFTLFLLLMGIFIARIGHWSLFHYRHYQKLAKSNFVHPQRLDAPRGRIFSRDGQLLAVNRTTYSLLISPFGVNEFELADTVDYIEKILNRDFSKFEKEALKLRPRWRSRLLARNLSLSEVSPFLERKWDLPGLRVASDFKRFYPTSLVCAHVVGYMGYIPPKKLSKHLEMGYARDDLIGIAGLEYQYENLLKGIPGRDIVQRDARGRFCKTLETEPAIPGHDLYLTLDLDFQNYAENLLGDKNGVILVMNPQNGDVLVMVSTPTYDPNKPGSSPPGLPVSFLNKSIQENFLPASTFKLITALSGLDSGCSPDLQLFCDGYYYLPNWKRPYKCELTSGHGNLVLFESLQYSCNIYFYQIARKVGATRLLKWALNMGYGIETGVDLPFEVRGQLPLQEADSMLPGNLLNLSIGQGKISVTPLQVLFSYCIFANQGIAVQPHLLKYYEDAEGNTKKFLPQTRTVSLSSENRDAILKGLKAVIYSPGGTAFKAGFREEWRAAGKTGTAERKKTEDDAWFVCFAPYDDPKTAVLVFLEEGGFGGSNAAPLARDLMAYYFQNRVRLENR